MKDRLPSMKLQRKRLCSSFFFSKAEINLKKKSFRFVFFLAGFETSATSMTFVLYELSRNMDIQRKARNEINKVLEKYNGVLSYESMLEMSYIDQIINGRPMLRVSEIESE